MIGISLSYKNLLFTDDDCLKPETLLPILWKHGVRSIELRSVPRGASPTEVLRVANILWDYGFKITVHALSKVAESAIEDIIVPLSDTLTHMRQQELIITVHPIVGDNVEMLNSLSDYIIEHRYPARIALENNRRMPDNTDGDSLSLVLDVVTKVDRKNIGICFDMGHYAWYTANFTNDPNMLPPKNFLSKVIHTHIHAYTEGSTHFPLDEWKDPFASYIHALGDQYFGVYNVELDPKRFAHRWSATEGYVISAEALKSNYPPRALFFDDMREHYDGYFLQALDVLNKKDGCYGALIAPSSYLFSTNGYRWAMDVSFLTLRHLATTPSRVREYLGNIDCMLLTHAHADHMEEFTVRALANTKISWVAPTFLVDKLLSLGVHRELITAVSYGDEIYMGPLKIRVLEGKHFRPGTKSGIEEVGYLISAENAPTLAFPGDVRDYSVVVEESLNADHCFAHVWLTDNALDPELYIPKSREFAEYMLSKSRKSIFLAHLYITRSNDKRWTVHHARFAAAAINELSPETIVRTPRFGEIFDLSV